MNYKQFQEDFDKKYFTSLATEYKRNFTAKEKFKVFANQKDVYEFLSNKLLTNIAEKKKFVGTTFVGDNLGNKRKPIFVIENQSSDKESLFAYRYKLDKDFYTITVRYIQKKNFTLVKIDRHVKWFKSILGLNGQLGKWNFKKKHKEEVEVLKQYLENSFK